MVETEFSCEKAKLINTFLKQMLRSYFSSKTESSEHCFEATVNLYQMFAAPITTLDLIIIKN